MVVGEVREFDFLPFYINLRASLFPIPLSGVKTVLLSSSVDATPYPFTFYDAIPDGFVRLPYVVSLGRDALDLLLISKRESGSIETLGVIKGYEFVIHLLENTLRNALSVGVERVEKRVFSDVVPGVDAFVVYGDSALRGFEDFPFTYNLSRIYWETEGKELDLAFWIAKEDLAYEAERELGKSLAVWFMETDRVVEDYAKRRRIPLDVLKAHVRGLRIKYVGGRP